MSQLKVVVVTVALLVLVAGCCLVVAANGSIRVGKTLARALFNNVTAIHGKKI